MRSGSVNKSMMEPAGTPTSVILCTRFSEWLTEESLKEAGIAALVRKPFLKKDIAKMIRDVLETH
jgi:hypothetical protein